MRAISILRSVEGPLNVHLADRETKALEQTREQKSGGVWSKLTKLLGVAVYLWSEGRQKVWRVM